MPLENARRRIHYPFEEDPETGQKVWARNKNGIPLCNALKRQPVYMPKDENGPRCTRRDILINGRCPLHGGLTPRGIGSGQLRTGSTSMALPRRLQPKFDDALNDPELLSLRTDVALTEARTAELLENLTTGESGELWDRLAEKMNNLVSSFNDSIHLEDDRKIFSQRINAVVSVLEDAEKDQAVWREVRTNIEQKRRLTETEQKRLIAMNQMITVEQLMVLVTYIRAMFDKYVTDPQDRELMQAEFAVIMS